MSLDAMIGVQSDSLIHLYVLVYDDFIILSI
jgi:hypothetical protein